MTSVLQFTQNMYDLIDQRKIGLFHLLMMKRHMLVQIWPRGKDVHAVIAVVRAIESDVMIPKVLSNARSKLPDFVAPFRTFVGMLLQEMRSQFVNCLPERFKNVKIYECCKISNLEQILRIQRTRVNF